MTDSKYLRSKIIESGLKLNYISKKLGISYYTLHKKINNISNFNSKEINQLCNILKIKDLREKEKIFFKE